MSTFFQQELLKHAWHVKGLLEIIGQELATRTSAACRLRNEKALPLHVAIRMLQTLGAVKRGTFPRCPSGPGSSRAPNFAAKLSRSMSCPVDEQAMAMEKSQCFLLFDVLVSTLNGKKWRVLVLARLDPILLRLLSSSFYGKTCIAFSNNLMGVPFPNPSMEKTDVFAFLVLDFPKRDTSLFHLASGKNTRDID